MKGEIIMLKKYEVAISDNGICSKCKMVSEQEYNQLKKESEQVLAQERFDKQQIINAIRELNKRIEDLEKEIKVLKGEE